MKYILLFILLFCYVFAFYIAGISVSLLIAFPLYGYAIINKVYYHNVSAVFKDCYIKNIFLGWWGITILSIVYPLFFLTFDFSFFRVVGIQVVHLLAAIPVFAYLKYKEYTDRQVLSVFTWIFVVQTFIQCIVVSNPTLSELILYFNKFQPDDVVGAGSMIRGKALSAATTYHLSLVYGIGFIIYVKEFLSQKISLTYVFIGLLIFVGIFFAGRTGFVGVAIGLFAFIVSNKVKTSRKIKFAFQLLIVLFATIFMLSFILPDFYAFLEEQVFPYAFEFLYSKSKSGQIETASTNHLMEMWNRDFNYVEFLIGSGRYSYENGAYYMHVDPGILRHTLFMGIGGYLCLLFYQLILLPFLKMDKDTRFYYVLIFIYLLVMDFKGCTIGTNKFAFATSLLLSFSYFNLSSSLDRK